MRITWAWSLLFCFDQNKISRTVHNTLFAPNWNNYPPSPRAEMSQRPLPPRLIFDVCLVTSSTRSKMPSTAAAKWYKINTKVSSFQKSHHNHGIYSKLLYFIHKWWGASQAFYCVVTLHIMQHWVCETVDGSFLPINNKCDFGAKMSQVHQIWLFAAAMQRFFAWLSRLHCILAYFTPKPWTYNSQLGWCFKTNTLNWRFTECSSHLLGIWSSNSK